MCQREFPVLKKKKVYCSQRCWSADVRQKRASKKCSVCNLHADNFILDKCLACLYVEAKAARDARAAAGEVATCKKCAIEQSIGNFRPLNKGVDKTCEECRYFENLVRQFGYTEQYYRDMLLQQKNCCDSCGDSLATTIKALDHCYVTDEPRAFLCINCNLGVGAGRDHPDIFENLKELL